MNKEIMCEQKNICICVGRFSACYKPSMQTCEQFVMNDTPQPLSDEDLKIAERAMKPITDLNKLIDDHWSYINSLLSVHGESDKTISLIEFHYKSAFKHGYKHAKEE